MTLVFTLPRTEVDLLVILFFLCNQYRLVLCKAVLQFYIFGLFMMMTEPVIAVTVH